MSPTDPRALFDSTRNLVERTLARLGLDASAARAEVPPAADTEQASWTFSRGSAFVLVTVTLRPGRKADRRDVFLRVVSPVIVLPAAEKRGPLFEHLLELNAGGLVNSAFGVVGERVVVVSERPAAGLDEAEVEQILEHTSAVADTFDDRLVQQFGGTLA